MLRYSVCILVFFCSSIWAASGLTYSTYLRQGFTPSAVATDGAGNVYLAGSTVVDVSTSQTAAMVVKLNPAGAEYLYVRSLGGAGSDTATAIAIDSAGDVYVTGTTFSPDFPVTPGRQTGTLPETNVPRAFLVEFDPQGRCFSPTSSATSALQVRRWRWLRTAEFWSAASARSRAWHHRAAPIASRTQTFGPS